MRRNGLGRLLGFVYLCRRFFGFCYDAYLRNSSIGKSRNSRTPLIRANLSAHSDSRVALICMDLHLLFPNRLNAPTHMAERT